MLQVRRQLLRQAIGDDATFARSDQNENLTLRITTQLQLTLLLQLPSQI